MAAKRKWIILATLLLDSGTEYESDVQVNHPDVTYEARVLNWGTIDRSIPSPPGLPEISDARIRIADTDRKWRDLFAHQTPRRRTMELKLLQEGDSESATDPVYVGEIVDAEFLPGCVEISLRDKTFAWIDEEIPAMITKENFPDIEDQNEGGFLPIVSGLMRSSMASPPVGTIGVIRLPHLNWDAITGDRYGAAIHPIFDIVVYRQEQISSSPLVNAWVVVDPAEYNVTVVPMTLFGLSANPTFVDFLDEQPEGTEIRADIDGIDYRGGWGTLPPVGYHAVGNPGGTPQALRNPIDFFIGMTYLVMHKAAGASVDASLVFNQPALAALRTKFETLHVYCDGAVTKPITCREWLGQFLTSFNLDMYVDRNGLITLNFTDETDAGRPVFTEGRLVLKESFRERLPQPTINQVQFRYQLNAATEDWATFGIYDNLTDQDTLGSDGVASPEVRDPRIEKEVLDLVFVRDTATAEYIVSKRVAFLSLGSFRQEWQMPAPEVLDDLELAKLVGLTHSQGLETGGYVNREVKVIGLALDLDKLVYTVRGILRVPQAIAIPASGEPVDITGLTVFSRWHVDDNSDTEVWSDDFAYANGDLYPAHWSTQFVISATPNLQVVENLLWAGAPAASGIDYLLTAMDNGFTMSASAVDIANQSAHLVVEQIRWRLDDAFHNTTPIGIAVRIKPNGGGYNFICAFFYCSFNESDFYDFVDVWKYVQGTGFTYVAGVDLIAEFTQTISDGDDFGLHVEDDGADLQVNVMVNGNRPATPITIAGGVAVFPSGKQGIMQGGTGES